ncbi:Caveolin-2 [Intoshia linei]|uniref:Caveolin n=1 Tax=Intoshia linei TaxID=1819745 RepID=A0A177AXB7_9BILA|nr:Caveolin-2 [Intoshia linei]
MSISVEDIDLINRDPHNINDHVMIVYEDVFAEPEGIKSPEWIWKASYVCFRCGKNSSYKVLSFFCSCILGLVWGCQLGCLTFCNIWHITPCIRLFAINCGCLQKFWGTWINCCLSPICESCGLCFSKINVDNMYRRYSTDIYQNLSTTKAPTPTPPMKNKIEPYRPPTNTDESQ